MNAPTRSCLITGLAVIIAGVIIAGPTAIPSVVHSVQLAYIGELEPRTGSPARAGPLGSLSRYRGPRHEPRTTAAPASSGAEPGTAAPAAGYGQNEPAVPAAVAGDGGNRGGNNGATAATARLPRHSHFQQRRIPTLPGSGTPGRQPRKRLW
jgi:hypothetical protein